MNNESKIYIMLMDCIGVVPVLIFGDGYQGGRIEICKNIQREFY